MTATRAPGQEQRPQAGALASQVAPPPTEMLMPLVPSQANCFGRLTQPPRQPPLAQAIGTWLSSLAGAASMLPPISGTTASSTTCGLSKSWAGCSASAICGSGRSLASCSGFIEQIRAVHLLKGRKILPVEKHVKVITSIGGESHGPDIVRPFPIAWS